jgi:hypothetical protein
VFGSECLFFIQIFWDGRARIFFNEPARLFVETIRQGFKILLHVIKLFLEVVRIRVEFLIMITPSKCPRNYLSNDVIYQVSGFFHRLDCTKAKHVSRARYEINSEHGSYPAEPLQTKPVNQPKISQVKVRDLEDAKFRAGHVDLERVFLSCYRDCNDGNTFLNSVVH